MEIRRSDREFSVCKVVDYSRAELYDEFCFIGSTDEERSLVCPTESVPDNTIKRDDGWKAFRIEGELDFSMIGVLAKIAGILADNRIAIFVISTYNTDYVLTKSENYERALTVLSQNGYKII